MTGTHAILRRAAAIVLVAVASVRPAAGQTSLQIPLQFDFLNPGAKSKAMGGAFAGVADDATATFSNPAGLILVPAFEASVELRAQRVETPFLERGRLSGAVFNEGTDTVAGPVFGTSVGSDVGPAFLSAVVPFRNVWTLAAYRHELVRVEQDFLSNGVFQKHESEFTSRRDTPQAGRRHVAITTYGMSAAYRLAPELALGASATLYTFSIDSAFRRFDTVGFLGAPNLSVELGRSTQVGDDVAFAPTAGLMYGLSGTFRAGLVYRHGAAFTFRTRDGTDPERDTRFQSPHTIAVGGSWQPRLLDPPADPLSGRLTNPLTLAVEITHVRYQRLVEEFVTDQARAAERVNDFTIPNGTEFHVGVQYYPTTSFRAPKFRAGFWLDPDHSVRFAPSRAPTTVVDAMFDERLRAALSTGERLAHYTAGVGVSLTGRLDVNAALDVSSQTSTFSLSAVIR